MHSASPADGTAAGARQTPDFAPARSGARRPAATRRIRPLLAGLLAAVGLFGCASNPPMPTVEQIDLDRFMGDWYVIANIPTFLERDAHNAIERYELDDDGSIATTFRFRKDGFDGPERVYHPRGFVNPENEAEWGMRFVWPFRAEFLIIDLADDYSTTVIGRSARDYLWIMARTPEIDAADYERIVQRMDDLGYDTERIQRVPQRWPEPQGARTAADIPSDSD